MITAQLIEFNNRIGNYQTVNAVMKYAPMNAKEIRLSRLREIIDQGFGGNAGQCADFLGIKRPQMSRWVTQNEKVRQGISEESARAIEAKLRLRRGTLDQSAALELLPIADRLLPSADTGKHVVDVQSTETELEEAPLLRRFRRIPLVGEVQGGMDGYLHELEYPVGHGEGYVEWPSRDASAYALRVRGDSMHPRYRAGEFVIVEPSFEPQTGEDVVVRCKDGRKMLKMLNWITEDEIQFLSINDGFSPLTLRKEEIDSIQLASGRAPRSALIRE